MDVNENAEAGFAFGDPVTAADPDNGATLMYSLSGTDADSFTIVESSGQLKTNVKGVRKTYHCGGRIVYHRRDDRGPYGRWSGDCLGAREDSAGVT